MIARQWASSLASCFFTATSLGVPSSARRSVSSAITSRNIEVLLSGIGPHVEGVQRAGQHRIVADGGRQLDHALEPEPLAHGRERRVVHAPRREQVGRVAYQQRLVLGEPIEGDRKSTSELQSPCNLVCRLLLEKKKKPPRPPSATASIRRCS